MARFLRNQTDSPSCRVTVDALLSGESVFLPAVQLRLERRGQLEAHGLRRGNCDRLPGLRVAPGPLGGFLRFKNPKPGKRDNVAFSQFVAEVLCPTLFKSPGF